MAHKKKIQVKDYIDAILSGDRIILAKAITLIESNSENHREDAQSILQGILPHSGNSIRIGITGSPGAGKSTLIDSLGNTLCDSGHKVAVLAIDPSSSISKGSILGDKTRMERLSRHERSFIRPSPSGGTLGGVARKTRETILLCEAAGFDTILIETIGVGQSETAVRSMVDFFLLMILPGGGDELQGIKKGTVEMADAVIINKADGENLNLADITRQSYENALHYLYPPVEGWKVPVLKTSAINDQGVNEVWSLIISFVDFCQKSDLINIRRKLQLRNWVFSMVEDEIMDRFYNNSSIKQLIPEIERDLLNAKITPLLAAQKLLENFL